jgi:UDP-N-acetylglucosamine 2-epimerase (non-hydrolysing)
MEGVEAGALRLVGTNQERIIKETERLIQDRITYETMQRANNPYGDGRACERIVEHLRQLIVP